MEKIAYKVVFRGGSYVDKTVTFSQALATGPECIDVLRLADHGIALHCCPSSVQWFSGGQLIKLSLDYPAVLKTVGGEFRVEREVLCTEDIGGRVPAFLAHARLYRGDTCDSEALYIDGKLVAASHGSPLTVEDLLEAVPVLSIEDLAGGVPSDDVLNGHTFPTEEADCLALLKSFWKEREEEYEALLNTLREEQK